ncbi:hypothetical protein KGF54_000814 [Candida jiufengensis]|uniref:uncharacterized protein n=1 Tax=Candida jiufengensis TaxID=497108 RepID=UPI002224CD01|nr:uncharacterized protein KGF54_000814 [Candida jiufengensis]KAI5956339.1 hypothetical protein KGF54_000814 [Candida jiufengensis]
MNKFKDLPDIDTSTQEIFESSDHEDNDTTTTQQNDEFENINFDEKTIQFNKFHIINNNKFDFSGNVINSMGYQIIDNEKEETIDEKLARIKRELEEIRQNQDINVDELIEETKELEINSKKKSQLDEIIDPESINIRELLHFQSKPIELNERNIKQLSSIENKLNELESKIGSGIKNENENETTTFQLNINDLERKLDILEHSDYNSNSIITKVEKLTKEINKLELNKKIYGLDPTNDNYNESDEINNINKYEKINEIYKILPNLENTIVNIPIILKRIKNLNNLHNEMNESINLTSNLNEIFNNINKDFIKWDESIINLNSKLNLTIENFNNNSENVNNRILELNERIKNYKINK